MGAGVLDVCLLGVVVGVVVDVHRFAAHEALIGPVLEGLVQGFDLLVAGAAVERDDDLVPHQWLGEGRREDGQEE